MKQHETNLEMINRVTDFSVTGGLSQAFLLEALSRYADEVVGSEPWDDAKSIIDFSAWHASATEWQAELIKHRR
jgi:hypothetical protein